MNDTNTPQNSILIVDDTPANLRVLTQMLSQQGYQVRPARNGALALKTARTKPPDLILLDIQMPGMDGYEVCERLKADERTQDIPLIFISAQSDLDDKVRGFSLGAVDYITKPFQVEEVLARIKTHLTLGRLQKSLEEKNQTLQEALQFLQAAQQEMIQMEKMAALGQLIAGVAHEINTPLGAIRASSNNSLKALAAALTRLPQLFERLSPEAQADFFALVEQALQTDGPLTTRQKRQAKRSLAQHLRESGFDKADLIADTLADMGLYEEVEPFFPLLRHNEVDFLLGLAYDLVRLQSNHRNINQAVDRAAKVVFALKSYTHYDQSGEPVLANIEAGLETVLTLYYNYLKKGVEIVRDYADMPDIWCYPDELNQVWTNLIHNALQAMQYQGRLEISLMPQHIVVKKDTLSPGDYVVVSVTDDGPGIPDTVRPRLFEPFYTTKAPGEGSGLGLNISQKIVEKHGGQIIVTSRPGETTFSVWLPMKI